MGQRAAGHDTTPHDTAEEDNEIRIEVCKCRKGWSFVRSLKHYKNIYMSDKSDSKIKKIPKSECFR